MDLREQEYVVALAKYQNITKAAEALYISQPTLSIFISRLEKRMGIKLFQHIGKKMVPTYAGEIYVKRAKELLLIQDQFNAELADIVAGYTGKLKIGIHLRRTAYIIPKVLMEFEKIYPKIDVVFYETDSKIMEDMLIEGEVDLILTNNFFNIEKLEIIPIYEDKILLVISSEHPACRETVQLEGHEYPWIDLEHIKNEKFIIQSPEQSIRKFINYTFEYSKFTPNRTFQIRNMETAAQLAAEGYGLAFTMKSYAKYFKYSKPVNFYEVGDPNFSVQISMVYRKKSYLPIYAVDFIELVKKYFNE